MRSRKRNEEKWQSLRNYRTLSNTNMYIRLLEAEERERDRSMFGKKRRLKTSQIWRKVWIYTSKKLHKQWISSKRVTPRILYSDCWKPKTRKILKAAKQMSPIAYKRSSIRLTGDFSSEGSGMAYINCWRNKTVSKESVSSKTIVQKWEFMTFQDKQKLGEFIAGRLTLQEMLKKVFQAEIKGH